MSGIKIDLKALKNSYKPKKDGANLDNEETTTQEKVEISTPAVSSETALDSTKNELVSESTNSKIPASVEIQETNTLETPQVKEVIKDEIITEEKEERKRSPVKTTKINLMGIKSLDNTEEKIEKEKQEKEKARIEELASEEKETSPETKEIFTKYTSDFVKNKETVIERIKKLKNIPKTRMWLLASLVLISSVWIWSLFIINPEIHSVENYKASILGIFKEAEPIVEKPIKVEEIPLKEEVIVVPSKVEKWWITINFESKNVDWQETIIYNWKTYHSKIEFEMELNKIVEKLKVEKLTDYLRNK